MKSSASESKPIQSRSKGEIPGRTTRKERLSRSKLKQAFLIDSDAKFLMYLIQFTMIRFLNGRIFWLCNPFTPNCSNSVTVLLTPVSTNFCLCQLWNGFFHRRHVITRLQAFTAQTVQKRAWFRCLQESA